MIINNENWRDCQAWKETGLKMNTTSNEACKLFDVTLSQYIGWYDNEKYGGIEGSLNSMLHADENFIMGHVLKNGIDLIGSSSYLNNPFCYDSVKNLTKLANKLSASLTKSELCHVDAIKSLYQGNVLKACDYWETILVENPTDILALKFAHDMYFYLGQHAQMRDSIARVLPSWESSTPLYSYVHGMHSFGLAQSNFFAEAEKAALKSLELNKHDAWATHTLCHLFEYKNDFNSGIKFLRETESDWSVCNVLSPHNYWHLALYHLERNEHEICLSLFDEYISGYLNQNRTLDLVDLASLLFRLKLDGCKLALEERWSKLRDVFKSRVGDHAYTFNDCHVLMILSACKDSERKVEFYKSLEAYLNTDKENSMEVQVDSCNNLVENENSLDYLKRVSRQLPAVSIFDALCHFDNGEFGEVVDKLYPIRYDLVKIGGSNAQRDVFHQILTQSALRADSKYHNRVGLALLNERLALKPNSNLNKRLAARFASIHHGSEL